MGQRLLRLSAIVHVSYSKWCNICTLCTQKHTLAIFTQCRLFWLDDIILIHCLIVLSKTLSCWRTMQKNLNFFLSWLIPWLLSAFIFRRFLPSNSVQNFEGTHRYPNWVVNFFVLTTFILWKLWRKNQTGKEEKKNEKSKKSEKRNNRDQCINVQFSEMVDQHN